MAKNVPTADTLTDRQKEFLRENMLYFYSVFVDGDPDLAGSECDCCAQKRALLENLTKAG